MTLDPYAVLGVAADAPEFIIQAAYRACIKRYHPDHYKGSDARERTAEILEAYRLIGDPTVREHYDRSRPKPQSSDVARGQSPPPPPPATQWRDSGRADGSRTFQKIGSQAGIAALVVALVACALAVAAIRLSGARSAAGTARAQPTHTEARANNGSEQLEENASVGTLPRLVQPAELASAPAQLDEIISFRDPSHCVMVDRTERLFKRLIRVNSTTYVGSAGSPISIDGIAGAKAPTFERRVDRGEGYDIRDNEATLTLPGTWHGLRVSKIRYRFMERSSFWEMQVRFLESPEQVRKVLNSLGFSVPGVGRFKVVSGPSEVTEGMGVESIPGGAALTCGSSMYY